MSSWIVARYVPLINLTIEAVKVYNLEYDDLEQYTFADSVKAGIYDNLTIVFGYVNS